MTGMSPSQLDCRTFLAGTLGALGVTRRAVPAFPAAPDRPVEEVVRNEGT
jgi:hypothetical protein